MQICVQLQIVFFRISPTSTCAYMGLSNVEYSVSNVIAFGRVFTMRRRSIYEFKKRDFRLFKMFPNKMLAIGQLLQICISVLIIILLVVLIRKYANSIETFGKLTRVKLLSGQYANGPETYVVNRGDMMNPGDMAYLNGMGVNARRQVASNIATPLTQLDMGQSMYDASPAESNLEGHGLSGVQVDESRTPVNTASEPTREPYSPPRVAQNYNYLSNADGQSIGAATSNIAKMQKQAAQPVTADQFKKKSKSVRRK